MKVKVMQEGYDNTPIVLAVVGHCDPLFLDQIKQTIESLPHFKVVFVKTSHGKLFIVGEQK
jgi:nitrate reductase NapAB chaperone NapD